MIWGSITKTLENTMLNKPFTGHLIKHTFRNAEGNVYTEMAIKTVATGDLQLMGGWISKALEAAKGTPVNIAHLFTAPIMWKRIVIDLENLHTEPVAVAFDEMEFEANLRSLTVSVKVKGDMVSFDYTLALSKESDTEFDTKFATTYLKYKEEDENGKKKIVNFPIEITIPEA